MGGPPLVTPTRVKVGGSDENEEEERRIRPIKTLPRPVHILHDSKFAYFHQISHIFTPANGTLIRSFHDMSKGTRVDFQ